MRIRLHILVPGPEAPGEGHAQLQITSIPRTPVWQEQLMDHFPHLSHRLAISTPNVTGTRRASPFTPLVYLITKMQGTAPCCPHTPIHPYTCAHHTPHILYVHLYMACTPHVYLYIIQTPQAPCTPVYTTHMPHVLVYPIYTPWIMHTQCILHKPHAYYMLTRPM